MPVGVYDRTIIPAIDRFKSKFHECKETGCWIWNGSLYPSGYGQFFIKTGKTGPAHLWAYEHFIGKKPAGLDLDHLCRNRACCNPNHLEPVTRSENALRGIGPGLVRERMKSVTHCPKGHPYSPENTRFSKLRTGHLSRLCRTCGRMSNQKRRLALNGQPTDQSKE